MSPPQNPAGRSPVRPRGWWYPWVVIAAVLVFFGKDFLFFNRVFLPMDWLQYWRPWDTLFPSKTPLDNAVISDVAEYTYPLLHFISENLKAGLFPLWNPFVFLGLPTAMMGVNNYLFNPQYVALLWAFSPATGHSLAILIDLGLIASFSYLFFLRRGLTRMAALFGSLVLTFNGHLMVWLEFGVPAFAYAGMAVSLYCFERSLQENRSRFLLLNGVTMGLLLLGGSIQWAFFLVPLMGLYACARTVEAWDWSRTSWERLRPLRLYTGALVIGVIIASPGLLFFLDYAGLSQRSILSFELMKGGPSISIANFATFLFPNLFGYQPAGVWYPRRSVFENYAELCVYMGVATIPLAALALRVKAHRVMTVLWLLIAGGALLVAMRLPLLYFLLYHYVPGFNGMQPTRTIILLPPAFAFLAAIGMNGLQRTPLSTRESTIAGIVIAGIASVSVVLLGAAQLWFARWPPVPLRGFDFATHFRIQNPDFWGPILLLALIATGFLLLARRRIGVTTLCAGLVALLLVDLVPLGLRLNTRVEQSQVYPPTTGLPLLAQDPEPFRTLPVGFRYNTLMVDRVAVLGGYASMFPASYFALLAAMESQERPGGRKLAEHNPNYVDPTAWTSKLLPMLNVKYLIAPYNAELPETMMDRYELKHRSDISVFQAKAYLPRAFVVYDYRVVESAPAAIQTMLGPEFDPARTALVDTPIPGFDRPQSLPPPIGSVVEVSRPSSDRLEITSRLADRGLLVVSEQFFPGWEARVDGQSAQILKVNTVLMGVVVPAGEHRVSLRFLPTAITTGFPIAAVAGTLCLLMLVLDWVRHRKVRVASRTPDPRSADP